MIVTVVYALPHEEHLEELDLPEGTTAEDAIRASHIPERCSDVDLETNKVGVFGKLVPLTQELHDGDRVEIYRPLPRRGRDPYARERIQKKKERRRAEEEHAGGGES